MTHRQQVKQLHFGMQFPSFLKVLLLTALFTSISSFNACQPHGVAFSKSVGSLIRSLFVLKIFLCNYFFSALLAFSSIVNKHSKALKESKKMIKVSMLINYSRVGRC